VVVYKGFAKVLFVRAKSFLCMYEGAVAVSINGLEVHPLILHGDFNCELLCL
jgi:hypothetical protein